MKKWHINWVGFTLAILMAPIPVAGIDPITADALKVQHILKTIESHHNRPTVPAGEQKEKSAFQQVMITEKELNNYFTYRLAQEKNPLIEKVDVVLGDRNQIRGNVRVNFEGIQLLSLFGSQLNFDFDGKLQTEKGAGNLGLTSLSLNDEPVPPNSLDPILFALAQFYGHEAGTIDDWYELPHGIQRIELKQAKAILFY